MAVPVRETMVRTGHPLKRICPMALVLVMFLAGCVSPDNGAATDPTALVEETLRISHTCPPGETLTLSNGLCVTTFVDPRQTFEEPYIAVHPQRPEVIVLGMNAWHADPRPVLRAGVPSLEVGRVALFVTEDGGVTWQRVDAPPILYGTDEVGKTSYSGDPTLAFDSRGVLHYFQTSVAFDEVGGGGFPYIDIQYARSEDLGATWSVNKLLADDGDNDRPWVTIGPDDHLFATWRDNMAGPRPPQLGWSKDGGTTWQIFSAPPECTDTGRAIVYDGSLLMPCALLDDGKATKLQLNRFDLATQRFEVVGPIPAPKDDATYTYTQWDRSPDGRVLALATRTDSPHGFVTFSRDGGANWSEPLTFLDLCTCQPETGALHAYGAKFDAAGGFHVLLADAMVETPDSWSEGNTRYAAGKRAVFHLVVDTSGDTLLATELTTSMEEDPRNPPSAGPPIGRDDYYVPAFWNGGGAIAWTRDKGVDLAHVVAESTSEPAPS